MAPRQPEDLSEHGESVNDAIEPGSEDILLTEDEDGMAIDENTTGPLLPTHLLKATPTPRDYAPLVPEGLTRKQKRAIKAEERTHKRQLARQIMRNARGSGVVEAGVAAQIRRGLIVGDKVMGGRVEMKEKKKPVRNEREAVMNERKRTLEMQEDPTLAVQKQESKKRRRTARSKR